MSQTWKYAVTWTLMIVATFAQVYLVGTPSSTIFKQISIITISVAEAIAAAAYYQNLRHETKALSLLPIASLLVIATLVIVSLTGGA